MIVSAPMNDILLCPVCGNPLIISGIPSSSLGDETIYHCPRKTLWVPELEISMEIVDITLFVKNSNPEETFKIVEIPPYTFVIDNISRSKKTTVNKNVRDAKFPFIDLTVVKLLSVNEII